MRSYSQELAGVDVGEYNISLPTLSDPLPTERPTKIMEMQIITAILY